MAGMTATCTNNLSDYDGRVVELSVSGVCRQNVMRMSNYTVKVPHSRMSEEIQNIHRLGGKVAGVKVLEYSESSDESSEES